MIDKTFILDQFRPHVRINLHYIYILQALGSHHRIRRDVPETAAFFVLCVQVPMVSGYSFHVN